MYLSMYPKWKKNHKVKTFGPVDFVKVTTKVKESLSNKLRHPAHRAIKLLGTLVFEYDYVYMREKYRYTVDCNKVWKEITCID